MAATDSRSVIPPLRWIFWGALIVLVDVTYSDTVNGGGWRFDFLNDAVGMAMILWGTAKLAKIRVTARYRTAMRFVMITAVLSMVDAIHGHFIYETPPGVAIFFSVVGVASMIATVVFCVAMRWLSDAAGLSRSARSWRTTAVLFVVVYLIPIGSLSLAAAIAVAMGSPLDIGLGTVGLLLVPVFCSPLIHFFLSTSRMKNEAGSTELECNSQPLARPEANRPTRLRPVATLLAVAVLVIGCAVALAVVLPKRDHGPPPTHAVTATVDVGHSPTEVAVDPGSHTVYVTHPDEDTVSVIDGETHAVTATVTVGDYPTSVAVDPNTHTAYVANGRDDTVSVIDGSTHSIATSVPLRADSGPVSLAVDPTTRTVYVANKRAGTVSVIDGARLAVTDTVTVGRPLTGLAVDPATHTVCITDTVGGLAVLDGPARRITATVDVGEPAEIMFNTVAVDPATHTAYVSGRGSGGTFTVAFVDLLTNSVGTVDAGTLPNGVAVDPGTRAVYVANSEDDTVSVIDGSTHAVTATVEVGRWPAGVAVDSVTHAVYVADSSGGTVSVIEPR